MHIAILGPGRSGTSLLTKLFESWGFSIPLGSEHLDAQAGFEHRIGLLDNVEIHKDPWAFTYIRHLEPTALKSYDAFILPIRNVTDAAMSRSAQERLHRLLNASGEAWLWDHWGTTPGGAVSETSASAIEGVLEVGLWQVMETLAEQGIQPIIIHFPRFAKDFDYVWEILGDLIQSRCNREEAKLSWASIVDEDKIRIGKESDSYQNLSQAELIAIVNQLGTKNRALDALRVELTQANYALSAQLSTLSEEMAALQTKQDLRKGAFANLFRKTKGSEER